MNRYRVTVVASYPVGIELMQTFAMTPRGADIPPDVAHWETSATDWWIEDDVRGPPLRQTLTVAYDDVAGRDESEAELFALAIFATESQPASLPRPESVVAHSE
ncbi:MAG TPA: hypothetical protein VGI55_16160 [Solirubrobacteraceae bacterium]|jgi:hypothetical protein